MNKKRTVKRILTVKKTLTGDAIGATLGDISKLSAEFYRSLVPQVKKLGVMGEARYHALVATGVEEYAKAKKISLSEKRFLSTEAKRTWTHLKKRLQK
jgi:hypothetical protein